MDCSMEEENWSKNKSWWLTDQLPQDLKGKLTPLEVIDRLFEAKNKAFDSQKDLDNWLINQKNFTDEIRELVSQAVQLNKLLKML